MTVIKVRDLAYGRLRAPDLPWRLVEAIRVVPRPPGHDPSIGTERSPGWVLAPMAGAPAPVRYGSRSWAVNCGAGVPGHLRPDPAADRPYGSYVSKPGPTHPTRFI